MMQTELLATKSISSIGEEISHELGAKMVKAHQTNYAADVQSYIIGRNIIEQILAQPGCAGIRFYNACKENGEKTLVYVGLDQNGAPLLSYQTVNHQGVLEIEKGIVADKVNPYGRGGNSDDNDSWWIAE